MTTINTNVGSPGTIGPAGGSSVLSYNSISAVPTIVAGLDPQRQLITFYNPGLLDVYVAPTTAQNSGSDVLLTPSITNLGGCFIIPANGGSLSITGECQKPWQAFTASGTGNPLTVTVNMVSAFNSFGSSTSRGNGDQIFTQLTDVATARLPTGRETIYVEHLGVGYAPSMMPMEKVASQPAESIRTQDLNGNWYVGNRKYLIPQDFGWKPGDDVANALRAAYAEVAISRRERQIVLTADPSRDGGSYRAYTPDPASGNVCVLVTDPNAGNAQLLGLGRNLTSIQYDHAAAYALAGNVRKPRNLMTFSGVDGVIKGITFDGQEQGRVPYMLTLVGNIGAGDTTITVNDTSVLPTTNGHLLIGTEYIVYLAIGAGNTLTGCVRGCRNTTAATHNNGDPITFQLRTGHHGLAINNFSGRFVLEDVAIFNAIAYGLGIENTGTEFIRHLTINRLRVNRCGSDGIDIKCPVADGNRYTCITNSEIQAWGLFSGYVTNPDLGIDNRTTGARFDNIAFIYTAEQGPANGMSHRPNQVAGVDPDDPDAQSGAQFTGYGTLVFEGSPGSPWVQNGVSSGGPDASYSLISARSISNFAINFSGDRNHITYINASGCGGGISIAAADCSVGGGVLEGLTNEGVFLQTTAVNARVGDVKTDGGTISFRSTGAATGTFTNCVGAGYSSREYQLTSGARIRGTPGDFTLITAAQSPYSMTAHDTTLFVDATAGNVTVIPPDPTTDAIGLSCRIMKVDASANVVTIDPPSTLTINGKTTATLTSRYQEIRLQSDATEYKAAAPRVPGTAFLTGTGTWTVPSDPSGFVYARFAFVTAGGGGGGVANAAAITTATSGLPGWTGILQLKIASGTVVSFVNGAGGNGGAPGNNNGANGANSTITIGATTYTFAGGLGGAGSPTGNAAATTVQTLAAFNASTALMTFTPTADAFYVSTPAVGAAIGTGAINIGGQARDTVYGLAGVAAVNAAGGNATGYGGAGAGAGHDAATLSNLAGGNGSAGCLHVTF